MDNTIKVEVITTTVYNIEEYRDTPKKSEIAVRRALRVSGLGCLQEKDETQGTTIIKVNGKLLTGR